MAEKHIKKYPNGATFIYYQQNINSSTNATIGFVCGAEKDGKKHGLAHALEHCLFHGIPDMTGDEIDEYMHFNAVDHNAYTNQDVIAVKFDCPNTYLQEVMKINSDMLAKNDFDEKQWESEREVILQERNVREDNLKQSPIDTLDYIESKNTFGLNRLIGNEKTLDKITTEDLKKYKNKYFVSENLVVSVVSSLPYDIVKDYVENYYINRFPSNPKNKVEPKKRTYEFNDSLLTLYRPGAKSFNIKFIFEGMKNQVKNEVFSVFEEWYFNGLDGRLDKELRKNYPLTYSSYIYDYNPKDACFKVIDVTTSPDFANDAIYLTAETLKDLIDNGISEKDFYMFQKYFMANRERKTNLKMRSSGSMFNAIIAKKKPFVKDFYSKVLSLTREEINQYFKDIYGNSKLMLGYDGDIITANFHLLINEPILTLNPEVWKSLNDPLLTIDEVLEIYRPKDRLNEFKRYLESNIVTEPSNNLKPVLNKKSANEKIKEYFNSVLAEKFFDSMDSKQTVKDSKENIEKTKDNVEAEELELKK